MKEEQVDTHKEKKKDRYKRKCKKNNSRAENGRGNVRRIIHMASKL